MLPGISRKGVVIAASPRPAFSSGVSAREMIGQNISPTESAIISADTSTPRSRLR